MKFRDSKRYTCDRSGRCLRVNTLRVVRRGLTHYSWFPAEGNAE
jgi:hypothetical protein